MIEIIQNTDPATLAIVAFHVTAVLAMFYRASRED